MLKLNNQDNINSSNIGFREAAAPLAKPIETVENAINDTVDTFVKQPEDERKKKSNKTAITVASTVVVLTGLVAILNPKISGKLVNRMKTMSSHANTKLEQNKNSFVKTKIYKFSKNVLDNIASFLQFTNTANGFKDIGLKKLCTETKGLKSVLSKPHRTITNWFDALGKHTVQNKYKNANKKLNSLNGLIDSYKNKLSDVEKKDIDTKLNLIKQTSEYFSKDKTTHRLKNQETLMSSLEKEFFEKMKSYGKSLWSDDWKNKAKTIKNNMTFWAEDMLMPERNKLEQNGTDVIDKIMGDGKTQRGIYQEIIEILTPHISQEEKTLLEKSLKKANQKLRKANHCECVEYFDKKRDLTLGGAPTDVLTAAFGLGMSGVAIGVADTKDEKISRALTVGFPAIAGIGASLAFTAMLFSGIQGMIYGTLASFGLSKIGSTADKYVTRKNKEETNV